MHVPKTLGEAMRQELKVAGFGLAQQRTALAWLDNVYTVTGPGRATQHAWVGNKM